MSLTLDLPKKLEATLSSKAQRAGMSLPDYALSLLAVQNIQTGAELVAYWKAQGVTGSRKEIKDSARHARGIRKKAETRSLKSKGE